VTGEQFDAKVCNLHDAIQKLTNAQLILELMELMAFIQDGHTAVWDVGEHPLFRAALPLRFFWFAEGLFVFAADSQLKGLLGAQIIAIDGRPAVEVLEGTAPYLNRDRGNPIKTKQRGPYALRRVALLHAAGLVNRPDRVTFTIRDQNGRTRDVDV